MNLYSTSLFLLLLSQICLGQYCESDHRFTDLEYFDSNEIDSLIDESYGHAINYLGQTDTLLFDIYFPAKNTDPLSKKPTVVLMHGGAFLFGNKRDRKRECRAFAKRGFVAITANYRLGWNIADVEDQPLASYRAQQDAHALFRYLVEYQTTYEIDTDQLFAGGSSAGAITMHNLVYMTQPEWNALYPTIESDLGSLDTSTNQLTGNFSIKGFFNNWGGVAVGSMQNSELLPQIAFQGEADSIVAIDSTSKLIMGSRAIHDRLVANGICSDLTVDPIGSHGILTNSAGAKFRVARTSCFFRSIICDNCELFYEEEYIDATCSQATSILDNHNTSYQLYPNPTEDILLIEGLEKEDVVNVYNSEGIEISIETKSNVLDLGDLKPGAYYMIISGRNSSNSFKLIKL